MRRDRFPVERGACLLGNIDVLGDEALDRVAAESTRTHAGEERSFRPRLTFAYPEL